MLLNNLHHLFISGRCRSRAASNLAAAIVRATSHLGGRIAANLAARITADLRRRQLVKLDGAVGILEAAAWSYTSGGVYGVIPDGILLVVGVHHHCTVAVVDTLQTDIPIIKLFLDNGSNPKLQVSSYFIVAYF